MTRQDKVWLVTFALWFLSFAPIYLLWDLHIPNDLLDTIYGLILYSATTRTQEIGIRMAVGAQRSDILRMMIREGLQLSAIGLAVGLAGAAVVARAGAALLFGVSGTDPVTFGGVSVLLTLIALAASYFPARRAARIDPIRALRCE